MPIYLYIYINNLEISPYKYVPHTYLSYYISPGLLILKETTTKQNVETYLK